MRICDVNVEFTKDLIAFEQDETKVIVPGVQVDKDFLPLFEAISEKRTYLLNGVSFKWHHNDMEVSEGENRITLKGLVGEQLEKFCLMAFKMCG